VISSTSGKEPDRSDSSEWIQSFRERQGRAPRILHVGNIANNAYLNAKILNKAGLDCDVICYDYYHIMGCPEWEDADFDGCIKDQFYPNWRSVNLNGFRKPEWFAQGPLRLCLSYLTARREGKRVKANLLGCLLGIARYLRSLRITTFTHGLLRNLLHGIQDCCSALFSRWYPLGRLIYYCALFVCIPFIILSYLFLTTVLLPPKTIRRIFRSLEDVKTEGYSFDGRTKELLRDFARVFPDRIDALRKSDLEGYKHHIFLWRKLFSQYDIIQAYSTDVVLPMLANNRPYVGFEHGTLREIPFERTPRGRTTALGYSLARHVLVTNSDCLKNAHILANGRVSFVSHPYDEDRDEEVAGFRELREELYQRLNANFLFFFPTRHDWVPDTGYADKANDVFLNAFCTLREDGYEVGMVCCAWGANVPESKDLLQKRGCSEYVYWSDAMGRIRFERTARASHVVIDQFKLGSFGGILFKAMAVGSPVCTYIEEDALRDRYPEIPPVINCRTSDDIVAEMKKIIESPAVLEGMSRASRNWIKKYHSSTETVRTQLSIYRSCLEER